VEGRGFQTLRSSGTSGSQRGRIPIASEMALPTTGAVPTIGVSPAALEGRSFAAQLSRPLELRRESVFAADKVAMPTGESQGVVQPTVVKNLGGRRAWVACSKAKASLSSVGSLYARPKNERPSGSPNTCPTGTVIFG